MGKGTQLNAAKEMDDAPFETMLARFGTRFTINAHVRGGEFRISPLGTYHWGDNCLTITVTANDESRAIPFGPNAFPNVHQSVRMTSIDYCAADKSFPLVCELAFIAPFYPQDFGFCSVPVIYVLALFRNTSDRPVSARLNMHMNGESHTVTTAGCSARVYEEVYNGELGPIRGKVAVGYLGRETVDIPPGQERTVWGVLAGYVGEAVLDVKGVPYRFRYAKRFKNIEQVLAYAAAHRERDLRRNEVFESTLFDSSLTPEMKELIAFGFQSFAANAWLAVNGSGDEWYSVWEGNCGYHSTIDVEYNQAAFYLQYWPELLRMLLDEWVSCKTDTGFMEHDMGRWKNVRRAEYGHPMQVEENANFIILLVAYGKATGDRAPLFKHFPVARELAEFLISCDTTDNGFPDQGVENTLDSGSYAVELSRDQAYLAMKCIVAYLMLAGISDEMGDAEFGERLRDQASKAITTLDTEAWVGDHYAVCLDQTVRGWNTYTMMIDNALFYPLRAGIQLPLRSDRIILNLHRSLSETTRDDGQRMSAIDNNGWFSQQMFRDMIASHLGIDLTELWSGYLAYQKAVNREDSNCYKDVWPPGIATLNYYPRGVAACGMLQSAGAVVVDALSKTVVAGTRHPGRLPLTMLAEWKTARIPWLEISAGGQVTTTGAPLPPGWKVSASPSPPKEDLLSRPARISAAPEFFLFWGPGEVSGRHGYWSQAEMSEGKPFEIRVWFRVGKEKAQDINVAVTAAKGIEVTPLDEETFTTLDPGELLHYAYRVRILPDYDWSDQPAVRASCFFRTESTNVTLPERTLVFTPDPRTGLQQPDIGRQEAGYRTNR